MSENILNMPIESLNLSTHAYSRLKQSGYYTVGKLVEATADELLRIRYLGKGTFDEIVGKLDSLGLSLKQEPPISDSKPEIKTMSKIYVEMKVEQWVNVEDIADYLGVTTRTIHSWIKAGKIPAYKVKEKYRFKISEVDEWLRAGRMAED